MAVAALFPVLLLACLPAATGRQGVHDVGDKVGWVPNYNYTEWTNRTVFYPGEWIGFKYQTGMYDVAMVNETSYERCDTSHILWQYNKSVTFLQLNETGRYYFICTRGYCYHQMKVSVLVVDRPSPAQPPAEEHKSGVAPAGFPESLLLRLSVAIAAAVCSFIFSL